MSRSHPRLLEERAASYIMPDQVLSEVRTLPGVGVVHAWRVLRLLAVCAVLLPIAVTSDTAAAVAGTCGGSTAFGRRMNQIIKAGVDRGASDLHIKAGDVFRARIDGRLVPLTKQALTPEQTKLGGVETHSDARRCADLFRRHRDAIDGVLVCLPNFGDEKGVADTLKLKQILLNILSNAVKFNPSG